MKYPPLLELPRDPRRGIAAGATLPPPILDFTNPGSSSPQNQQFAPPSVDQTRSVTMSSNSARNSDGQFQRKDLAAGQQGVGVSVPIGTGPTRTSSGERLQVGAKANIDQGTKVESKGPIALNVYPGGQNVSTPIVRIAEHLPVAVNRQGGGGSVKGVPVSVNIR